MSSRSCRFFLAYSTMTRDNPCNGSPGQGVFPMGNDSDSRTGSVVLLLLRDPSDRQSWGEFVDRYGPKIYGWCRRHGLQDADAEDVTQDVLTQMVRKLRTFGYDPNKGKF